VTRLRRVKPNQVFVQLPHFTVFDGDRQNHVDLIGIRGPASEERVKNLVLMIDNRLFEALGKLAE
jgi:hypothetical protein